jgi:hypothetical protein
LLRHADADFDNDNALFAIGGLFAAAVGLVIEMCNWTWSYSHLGIRDKAITTDPEWYQLFWFTSKPACWVEVVMTQVLMTAASSRPLWISLESTWQSLDLLFQKTGDDIGTLQTKSSKFLLTWPFLWTLLSLLLSILALCPKRLHQLLHIHYKILTTILHLMAISYLCVIRTLAIVGICFDLAAVRACAYRNESWCVAYFLWKDPREGSLWAL